MDGDNDHTPELKVLDAIYGQAEFGIRCEVGTLVRTVADAATALGHASNSETDADSAHIPQGALTMTGHLHLVADEESNRLIVELAELLLAHHRPDHLDPEHQLVVAGILELLPNEPDILDGLHGTHPLLALSRALLFLAGGLGLGLGSGTCTCGGSFCFGLRGGLLGSFVALFLGLGLCICGGFLLFQYHLPGRLFDGLLEGSLAVIGNQQA